MINYQPIENAKKQDLTSPQIPPLLLQTAAIVENPSPQNVQWCRDGRGPSSMVETPLFFSLSGQRQPFFCLSIWFTLFLYLRGSKFYCNRVCLDISPIKSKSIKLIFTKQLEKSIGNRESPSYWIGFYFMKFMYYLGNLRIGMLAFVVREVNNVIIIMGKTYIQ